MHLLLKSHPTKEFSAPQDMDAAQKRFLIPCSSPVHQVRCFQKTLRRTTRTNTSTNCAVKPQHTERNPRSNTHSQVQKPHRRGISPKQFAPLNSSPNVKHTLIYWWLFSASSPVVSSFPWQHCIWLQSPCEPTHFSFWSVLPPWPSRGGKKTGWAARYNDPLLIFSINSNFIISPISSCQESEGTEKIISSEPS